MRHNLKILPQYFDAQSAGIKNFEIRKHDRDFKIGDEIKLVEIDGRLGQPYETTGRTLLLRITYILSGNDFEGIEQGYSILSTERLED